ncbi:MAG TPA: hypothetical protein VHM25_02315 [Polyangiaceae bacterium]|jgi:hypothetical protein|nr:hypothetical protein [Polyangiaceae bacterium]
MSASRFLQWQASQDCNAELFRQASQLAQTARQHELAAWELAARESQARPRAKFPWLTTAPAPDAQDAAEDFQTAPTEPPPAKEDA